VDNSNQGIGKHPFVSNTAISFKGSEGIRFVFVSDMGIIRIIKSRRMRWAGHVARMGRRGTRIDYWWESQRERDH
jgi:hypothetical protein